MQEIKTYIVLASVVWTWIDNMQSILLKTNGCISVPRNRLSAYLWNNKPFNCGRCLSFWIGIIATCITFNILFLTLPLAYKILNKAL